MGHDYIRQEYIIKRQFLSETYTSDEVYVQTTHKQRTIDSANAQLEGIFAMAMSFPEVEQLFDFTTIPAKIDFSVHTDSDNCPRFASVKEHVKATVQNKET